MKTNNIKYTATKSNVTSYGEKADIVVNIRLNDQCKNGHQDFAITADIYKSGKRGDRAWIAGGCQHEEILKHFPEFKIFIDLHLSDFNGAPIYAAGNGFYHLKTGFEETPVSSSEFKKEYCDYYRITEDQFDQLNTSETEKDFAILLIKSGVIDRWKEQAKKGIQLIEELTGDEFLNDSQRSQFEAPSNEEIVAFEKRVSKGYYSEKNRLDRIKKTKEEREKKHLDGLKQRASKDIKKIQDSLTVELWLFSYIKRLSNKKNLVSKGFDLTPYFDDFIYYNHSNELKFNWRNFRGQKMSKKCFELFCDNLKESDLKKLPQDITFTLEGVKSFSIK